MGGSGVWWLEKLGVACGELRRRLTRMKWPMMRLVCREVSAHAKVFSRYPLVRNRDLSHTFQILCRSDTICLPESAADVRLTIRLG